MERLAKDLKRSLEKYTSIVANIDENEVKSVCSKALRLRTVLDVIRDLMPTERISRSSKKINYIPLQEGRILFTINDPVQFFSTFSSIDPLTTFHQSVSIILPGMRPD